MTGRFAPSPTGVLHLGNLRTAVAAWLWARSNGLEFVVRMEDLDRVTSSPEHAEGQLRDLRRIGLDWDGPVVVQSERFERYHTAIARLADAGLTYPCFCSRRDIRDAAAAPHMTQPAPHMTQPAPHMTRPAPKAGDEAQRYPGTCRHLSAAEVSERMAVGRAPAIRLRADHTPIEITDQFAGMHRGIPDDVVLRRGDGVPAYHLAVVIDDADQGVTQVLRADDLLSSTPSQVLLQRLLGLPTPSWAHIPLVVSERGDRLAKRDGAVTLDDLAQQTRPRQPSEVTALLLSSLGQPLDSIERRGRGFQLGSIPPTPLVYRPSDWG